MKDPLNPSNHTGKNNLGNKPNNTEEINRWMRHLETFWWALTSIILTITASAFYAALTQTNYAIFLIIGGSSIFVWVPYFLLTMHVYHTCNEMHSSSNYIKCRNFPKDSFSYKHGIDFGGFMICVFFIVFVMWMLIFIFKRDDFSEINRQEKNKTSTIIEKEISNEQQK